MGVAERLRDDKADKLSLQLDNFDLALFDREDLMAGAVLEVSWGYPGNMSPPRRVVVKSMKGFQALTLEGQALSALMNQQAKTRKWEGKTRSEVVREVAKDAGYEGALVDIDDTPDTLDVINQAAETDARFLARLAQKEGFQFFIDGTGLHFHQRRQDRSPAHVFTWYSDSEPRNQATPRASRWKERGCGVWARVDGGLVERVVEKDVTECAVLELWWVVCPAPGLDAALRLARDPQGVDLLPNGQEAAERRVAELEEELRRRG